MHRPPRWRFPVRNTIKRLSDGVAVLAVRATTYDALGRAGYVEDALTNRTTHAHDAAGRATATLAPLTNAVTSSRWLLC